MAAGELYGQGKCQSAEKENRKLNLNLKKNMLENTYALSNWPDSA
jgi:hypothetical protein